MALNVEAILNLSTTDADNKLDVFRKKALEPLKTTFQITNINSEIASLGKKLKSLEKGGVKIDVNLNVVGSNKKGGGIDSLANNMQDMASAVQQSILPLQNILSQFNRKVAISAEESNALVERLRANVDKLKAAQSDRLYKMYSKANSPSVGGLSKDNLDVFNKARAEAYERVRGLWEGSSLEDFLGAQTAIDSMRELYSALNKLEQKSEQLASKDTLGQALDGEVDRLSKAATNYRKSVTDMRSEVSQAIANGMDTGKANVLLESVDSLERSNFLSKLLAQAKQLKQALSESGSDPAKRANIQQSYKALNDQITSEIERLKPATNSLTTQIGKVINDYFASIDTQTQKAADAAAARIDAMRAKLEAVQRKSGYGANPLSGNAAKAFAKASGSVENDITKAYTDGDELRIQGLNSEIQKLNELYSLLLKINDEGLKYNTYKGVNDSLGAANKTTAKDKSKLQAQYSKLADALGSINESQVGTSNYKSFGTQLGKIDSEIQKLDEYEARIDSIRQKLSQAPDDPIIRAQSILDMGELKQAEAQLSQSIKSLIASLNDQMDSALDSSTTKAEAKVIKAAGSIRSKMDSILKKYGSENAPTGDSKDAYDKQYDDYITAVRAAYTSGDAIAIANLDEQKRKLAEIYELLVRIQAAKKQDTGLNSEFSALYSQRLQELEKVASQVNSSDYQAEKEKWSALYAETEKYKNLLIQLQSYKTDLDTGAFGDKANEASQIINDALSQLRSGASGPIDTTAIDGLVGTLKKLKSEAKNVKLDEALATNRANLDSKIVSWMNKNTSAAQRFKKELDDIRQKIKNADKEELANLTTQFDTLTNRAESLNKSSLFDGIKKVLGKYSPTQFVTSIGSNVLPDVGEAINTLKQVDTYLTEISKVSNRTTAEINALGDSMYDYADKYGVSVTTYLNGVQEWSRAGYEAQSEALGEVTMLAQAAGNMTSDVAVSYLVATNAAYQFQGSAEKLTAVLDGQNSITNRNAVSMQELAEATKVAAAQAASAGVGIDQFSAAVSTIQAVTQQGGAVAGRAYRAILMNLQQITGTTDDGEVLDESQFNKVEQALAAVGVKMEELRDGAVRLRDPMVILKELAEAFVKLDKNDARRANIISTLGGKTRGTQLAALLSNWQMYEKMLSDYNEGAGSAAQEAAKSAASWEGTLARMQNSWVEFVSYFANSDVFKSALNFINGLITAGTQLVSVFGKMDFSKLLTFFTTFTGIKKVFEWGGAKGLGTKFKDIADAISQTKNTLAAGWRTSFDGMGGQQLSGVQRLKAGIDAAKQSWRDYRISAESATGATKKIGSILSSVGNTLASMAIAIIASLVVNAIEDKLHEAERIKEEAEKAYSDYQSSVETNKSNRETIKSVKDEFAKLSQGVDSNGRNVSLTNDQYDRYISLSQQIASILPGLTNQYGENGEAMYVLKGAVDEYNASLETQLELEDKKARTKLISQADSIEQDFRNTYSAQEGPTDQYGYKIGAEAYRAILDATAEALLDENVSDHKTLSDFASFVKEHISSEFADIPQIYITRALGKYDNWLFGMDIDRLTRELPSEIAAATSAASELQEKLNSSRALLIAYVQEQTELKKKSQDIMQAAVEMAGEVGVTTFNLPSFDSSAYALELLGNLEAFKEIIGDADFEQLFDFSSLFSKDEINVNDVLDFKGIVSSAIENMNIADADKQAFQQQILDAFFPDMSLVERQIDAVKKAYTGEHPDILENWLNSLTAGALQIAVSLVTGDKKYDSLDALWQDFAVQEAAQVEVEIKPTIDISEEKKKAEDATKDISSLYGKAISGNLGRSDVISYVADHPNDTRMLELLTDYGIDTAKLTEIYVDDIETAYQDAMSKIDLSGMDEETKGKLKSAVMENAFSGITGLGRFDVANTYASAFENLSTALDEFHTTGQLSMSTLSDLDDLAAGFGIDLGTVFDDIDGELQIDDDGLVKLSNEIYNVMDGWLVQLELQFMDKGETPTFIALMRTALGQMKDELGDVGDSVDSVNFAKWERDINAANNALTKAANNRELKEARGERVTAEDYEADKQAYETQLGALIGQRVEARKELGLAKAKGNKEEIANAEQKLADLEARIQQAKIDIADTDNSIVQLRSDELSYAAERSGQALDETQSQIELAKAQGKAITAADYVKLRTQAEEQIGDLQKALGKAIENRDKQELNSAKWQEYQADVDSYTESITNLRVQIAGWNEDIRNLHADALTREADEAQQRIDDIKNSMELAEAQGKAVTADDYQQLIGASQEYVTQQKALMGYYSALLLFVEEGSTAYDTLKDKINGCKDAISGAEVEQAQWTQAIQQLAIDTLSRETDKAQRKLDKLQSQADLKTAKGQSLTVDDYRAFMAASDDVVAKQSTLLAANKLWISTLEEGSDLYATAKSNIEGCEDAIDSAAQSQAEWSQQIIDSFGYGGTSETIGTLSEAMASAFSEQAANGIQADTALNLANWFKQLGLSASDYLFVNGSNIAIDEKAIREQALAVIDKNIDEMRTELQNEADAGRREELELNLQLMLTGRAELVQAISPAAQLSASYSALSDKISAVSDAFVQQNQTGTMTLEQFSQLISMDKQFASMMEFSAGSYQLNAQKAYEYIDAQREQLATQAKLNKQNDTAKYKQNQREIDKLIAGYKDTGSAYANLDKQSRERLMQLLNENGALSQSISQYNLLASSLGKASLAYEKWLSRDNGPSNDDFYNAGVEAREAFKDGLKTGKIGTGTEYAYAEEYLFGDYGKTETGQKYMDRYFTTDTSDAEKAAKKEHDNLEKFLTDLADWDLAEEIKGENGETLWNIDTTIEQVMEKTKLSYAAIVALFKDLETYGINFDWEQLGFEDTEGAEQDYLSQIDAVVAAAREKRAELDSLNRELTAEEKQQRDDLTNIIDNYDSSKLTENIQDSVSESEPIQLPWEFDLSAVGDKLKSVVSAVMSVLGGAMSVASDSDSTDTEVNIDTADAQAKLKGLLGTLGSVNSVVNGIAGNSLGLMGTSALSHALYSILGVLRQIEAFRLSDKSFSVIQNVYTNTPSPISGQATARGTNNAVGGRTLVGELGKELLVRDGRYYELGANGAQFVNLKRGDIVLDAEKTRKIERGLPGARGKALASGTSSYYDYINKNSKSFSKRGITKKDWLDALLLGSKDDIKELEQTINLNKKQLKSTLNNATRVKTEAATFPGYSGSRSSGGGSGKSGSGSGSGSGGGGGSSSSANKELYDWIEVRIDRLQRKTDNLIASAEAGIGYLVKNADLNQAMENINAQIDTASKAYDRYIKQADTVAQKSKLSADLINKIKNGDIDLAKYSDSTQQNIEDYKEWYDKALEVQDSIADLKKQQTELATQKLDNIINQYDNLNSKIKTQASLLESTMSLNDSQGKLLDLAQYNELIDANNQQIANTSAMKQALSAELEASVSSGAIQAGSDEWYDYSNKISECDSTIIDLQQSTQDYMDKINEIKVDRLEFAVEEIRYMNDALEDSVKLKEATGKAITSADYKAQADNISQQVDGYHNLVAELKDQLQQTEAGSNKYMDLSKQIASAEGSIRDLQLQQAQLNQTIAELPLNMLADANTLLTKVQSNMQSLMDLHEAQGELLTSSEYEQLIKNGDEQLANLEAQRAELEKLISGVEKGSSLWQGYAEQLKDNADAILDIKTAQEQWNDAIIDLEIDKLQKQRDLLDEQNTKYQKRIELEKAMQELERAKTQRTKMVYREGVGFVYERDEQAVKDAQEALDDKRHEEVLDKIDEAIDALDKYKKVDNLYDYFANRIHQGSAASRLGELDDVALGNYITDSVEVSVKSIAQIIREAFEKRQNTADTQMLKLAKEAAAPVSVGIEKIVLSGVQDVGGLADAIMLNLPNVLTQRLMSNR